jgi:hypothetical protein
MAKRNLLDMTQGILSGLDSDEVNSISDTVESSQIANIIRRVYFDLIDDLELPHTSEIIALESLADPAKPTHMRMPEAVSRIEWIKYDTRLLEADAKVYRDIIWLHPYDFLGRSLARDSKDTVNYLVVQYSANITLLVDKTRAPTYWTSFDDEFIVFDAYDLDLEANLQSSKTLCGSALRPTFLLTDTFVPDLPENLFSLLYAQSEAMAHVFVKQSSNPKADLMEHRLRVRAQRNKWRQKRMSYAGPDYGRKH